MCRKTPRRRRRPLKPFVTRTVVEGPTNAGFGNHTPSPHPSSLNILHLSSQDRPRGRDAAGHLAVRGRTQVVKKRAAVAVRSFNQRKLQSRLRVLEIVDDVFRHIHQ